MLFNSIEFTIFLPLVFLLYWFVFKKKLRLQNLFIVTVSYLFYGWWDWRFLILMAFTTCCSYLSGVLIERARKYPDLEKGKQQAKFIAGANIVVNLLILCIFKYFNFFSDNLNNFVRLLGYELDWVTLDFLLPVGISFYTFQAISYTIDVYKNKIEATHDMVSFFAFVSFFPQLVAGPIERSTQLLPQFYVERSFDYVNAVTGVRQILWGMFKKIVVADNCATLANQIFTNYESLDGTTLFAGALLFTFQIYGDFSAYSDIAIGTARLFGIRLMRNFNYPYFSRDIAEFWRKWHISLTTWFRDYIYIPLGGSRGGKLMSIRNTMIIFLVSGLWHGANWTFIFWGLYHALLFLPLLILGKNRKHKDDLTPGSFFPGFKDLIQMILTFLLVLVGWVIFRAENMHQAWGYLKNMVLAESYYPSYLLQSLQQTLAFGVAFLSILLLILLDWISFRRKEAFYTCRSNPVLTTVLILLILLLGSFKDQISFIYFQF